MWWISDAGVYGEAHGPSSWVRTLLFQALREILGSKDFSSGSGGPALQTVGIGTKPVMCVKWWMVLFV